MKPTYDGGNVRARCPDCSGIVTTFERRDATHDFGAVVVDGAHDHDTRSFDRVVYILSKCAGCGRAGLAKIHTSNNHSLVLMEWFFPTAIDLASLPPGLPDGVRAEFREAELCSSSNALRAASGMFRSTLEKLLRANGYKKGSLAERIDQAAADGVITESRKNRAHEEIRVLGNDVLHDDWREVTADEVELAHHYAQRIAEDFYDDRPSVEILLKAKGRL